MPPNVECEIQHLNCLARYEILDTPPEPAFDDIVRLAAQICGVPAAAIGLFDNDRYWFKARFGLDQMAIPCEQSFCVHIPHGDNLLVVPDTRQDSRFRDNPYVTGPPCVRFYTGVALQNKAGHRLGALCVIDTVPRQLTPEQTDALKILAQQTLAQMDLRRQTAELERRHTELRSVTDNAPVLLARVDAQCRYIFANRAYEDILGVTPNTMIGRTLSEVLGEATFQNLAPYIARALAGEAVTFEPTISSYILGERVMHISYVPERGPDGTVIGFLLSALDITDRITLEAERTILLDETESLLAEALERADLDPLTGLLNHRSFYKIFQEQITRAEQDGTRLAVAVLDLDNFKFFNDAYGHRVGDDVLRLVADTLAHGPAAHLTLSRFGGDEFAVLMPSVSLEDAAMMASRFVTSLEQLTFCLAEQDLPIPLNASVGVAVYPDEAVGCRDLLELADTRLRLSKSGAGEAVLAADHLRTRLTGRVQGFSMLDALVTAVDNKDRYTRRHSEDVLTYSVRIAAALGWDAKQQDAVAVAALLHDVGKIGVPDHILRKPGKLTEEEFEAIKQHPMMGAVIVGAVPGFEAALDAVRHHHERWDGGGYPFGLCGSEIPPMARLMAVADAFSAMTTDRPYRKGMDPSRAMEILRGGAGTQWDPNCVLAFLESRT
jgi:diguanylate cyclase (GGDEF)-like protein/PAS domain S-box-containing protein